MMRSLAVQPRPAQDENRAAIVPCPAALCCAHSMPVGHSVAVSAPRWAVEVPQCLCPVTPVLLHISPEAQEQ